MDDVPSRIEHTILGPTTTWTDVTGVLDDAIEFGLRACLPPCYIERASEYAPGVDVTAVVGFPHGQHARETKCREASHAWKAGAAELDVVPNIGRLLGGETDAVRDEISELVAAVPVPVKIIVEAPLLSESDLREICEIAADAGAAFVKTATGFTSGGATVEDVRVMSQYRPVKASGGVGSWTFAEELFAAGADRIGASSGDAIVREYRESTESRQDRDAASDGED